MKTLQYLLFIVLCLTLSSFNKKEKIILKGDLYFKFFRIGNFYNVPDSTILKYKTFFDTTNFENSSKENKAFYESYKKLKEGNYLYKPFVDIFIQKDSIVTLYLDSIDYDKIKIHKLRYLQSENKKVIIKADVIKIEDKLYYCLDLKKVKVVKGKTRQPSSPKFYVEDYK